MELKWIERAKTDYAFCLWSDDKQPSWPNKEDELFRCRIFPIDDGKKFEICDCLENINKAIGYYFYKDEIRQEKINDILNAREQEN